MSLQTLLADLIFISTSKLRMAYALIANGSRRKIQLFEYILLFFTHNP
jgi:hypothetical protein